MEHDVRRRCVIRRPLAPPLPLRMTIRMDTVAVAYVSPGGIERKQKTSELQ